MAMIKASHKNNKKYDKFLGLGGTFSELPNFFDIDWNAVYQDGEGREHTTPFKMMSIFSAWFSLT